MESGSAVMFVSFSNYLSAPGGACHRNGGRRVPLVSTSVCTQKRDSSEGVAADSCKRYPSCLFQLL